MTVLSFLAFTFLGIICLIYLSEEIIPMVHEVFTEGFMILGIDMKDAILKAKERKEAYKQKRLERKKTKDLIKAEKERIAALPKSHDTIKKIAKVRKLSKHPEFIDVLQSIEKTTLSKQYSQRTDLREKIFSIYKTPISTNFAVRSILPRIY